MLVHGRVCKPFAHECWPVCTECWSVGTPVCTERWPTRALVCKPNRLALQAATDTGMPHNPGVKILQRPQGWIRVAKMARQPDPPHLAGLKAEITRRWPLTGLLDVLKETELRVVT